MADWKYERLCSVALSKDFYPEFLLNEESGQPDYEAAQDRVVIGLYGLYGLSIDNDTKKCSIVFVPTSDLNKPDFSKTFSPAVQVLPQGPDGSARAEPYTLALSHDETRLALAFPPPSGSESDPWLIDIHATSNLRAGDGRAIVSMKLPHDVRFIRWARVGGKEGTKFLVGGTTELSAFMEGEDTTKWNRATRPPVEGNAELGWADWGWEGDLIAVSYFGQRADPPPESKYDPTFVSPGRLELVRPSTWSVIKSLPCVVRDATQEPVGADQVDPATGKSFLHGPHGTDDQTFATRFDRRNMVHVEWVHRDLLVAISRCSDVGAVHSPVTTHYQLDTDELDPAVISPIVGNESARFHVAYLAATKLLVVGVTQSSELLMSDLSEPVLTLQELEQSRKPQPRPVGEPIPDFYRDADEDDSFCVGLGMLPVRTELGKISEETGDRYRPLLIAVSATGRLHFFALFDGTSARAERIAITDPIPAPPAVPTPHRPPPTPTPPLTTESFKAPVVQTSSGQVAVSEGSQAQAVGGGGSAGTSSGQPSPFSFPSTASSKPSAFAGSAFSFGGESKSTAAPAPSTEFSATSFGAPTTGGTSGQQLPTSSAPSMSSFGATWSASGAGNRLGGGQTTQPPLTAPAPSIKPSFAPSSAPAPAPAQKTNAPWSSGAAAAMPLPRDDDDDGMPATVNAAPVRERDAVVKRDTGGVSRRREEPRRDHERAHTDDEQLAEKALRALPGTPGAPPHTVRTPSGAAAKSGGGSEVDKAWEELLKLAEHRETGVQDPALQLLKDPKEQAERTNAMTQLKRWTQDLVDRVELWEAETDKLEEQVVTLYGKLPELKRLIHDFELMKADEDDRRQAEKGERGVEVNRAKPWEADYLDAFACEQREKLEEQVEELAREIGSLMGPNQRGFGVSGGSKVAEEQRRRREMAQRFGVDGQEQIRRAEREAKLLKKELQFLEGQLRSDPATSDQLNRYLRQVTLSKRRMSGGQSEDAMVVESVFDADLFTTEVREVHDAEMVLRHELGMFRAANDAEIKQGRPDPLLVSVKRSPLSDIGESREAQLAKLRAKQEDRVRKNMEHVASYGGAMISTAPRTTAPPPSITAAAQRAPPPAPASAPSAATRTASQAFSFTGPLSTSTTSTAAPTQPPRRHPSFTTLSSAATAPSASTSTSLFQQPKPESASVKPPAPAPSPAPASQASTTKPPSTAEAKAPAPAAPLPPMSMKAPSAFQMPGATAKPPAPAPGPSAKATAVPMPPWPSQAPKPPSALMGTKPVSTTTATSTPTTTTTSTHTPAFDFSNLSLKSTKTEAGSTANKAPAPAPAPANTWATGSSAFGPTTGGGTSQPAPSSLFSPPTATQPNKPQAFSFPSASTPTNTQPTTTTTSTTPAPETPQKAPAPAPSNTFQSGGAFGQATGGSSLFKGPSTPPAGGTTGAPSQAPTMGSLSLGGLSTPQSQQQQTQAQTPATTSAGTAAPSPFATPQKPITGGGLFGQAAQGGMSGFSAFSPQQQQPQTPVQQQAGGAFGMGGFGGQQQQQQQQAVGGAGFPPPGSTVAQRLRMFYQKYAPDKAAKADQFAEKYKAEVPKMWATLFQKYPIVPQSEYQMWFPEYQQAAGSIPSMPGGGGAPPPMPTGNTGGAGYAFGQRGGMGLGTGIGSSPGATGSGFSSFANKGSPFSGATGGSPFGQAAQPFGSPAQQQQQQPSGFGGGMFAQSSSPFGGGGMQMGGQQQQPQQPTGFGFAQPQQQQQTGFGMFGQQPQQPTGFGFGQR